MPLRLRRHHNRFALGQNRSPSSRFRITSTKMCGAGARARRFPTQQPFRIVGGDPSALLGDADGHNFVFIFVDGVENRRGREQRDFMLSAAPTKQNADSNFFHDLSVWTRGRFAVNCWEMMVWIPWLICSTHLTKVAAATPSPSSPYPRWDGRFNMAYRIFFPNADSVSSTARSAVRLCSSITGFTSTISKLSMRPWSAMISIAR